MKVTGTPDFVDFIAKNADKSDFVKNSGKFKPIIMKVVNKALNIIYRPITFR